jgi:hypothetical protein
MNKIDKHLDKLMKKKRLQLIKLRKQKGYIIKIQRIIREYFENIYSNTFENLEEIDKFLATYDLPKLS